MKQLKILAVLIIAAVVIFQLAYPSATIRYRLVLEAEVDGKPATGSGVIEVTYRAIPRILGASSQFTIEVRGEAVALDLGERGTLFAMLAPGSHVRSGPEYIVPFLFGLTNGGTGPADFSSIRALGGRHDLPLELLPALVRFDDPRDPSTAKFVDASSLGLGVPLQRASIEIVDAGYWPLTIIGVTGVPVSREIDQKLPWVMNESNRSVFWRALYSSGFKSNGSIEVKMLLTQP
jgi:hypothetical protein